MTDDPFNATKNGSGRPVTHGESTQQKRLNAAPAARGTAGLSSRRVEVWRFKVTAGGLAGSGEAVLKMVGSGAVTRHGAPEQQQRSGRNSRSVDFDRDVKLAGRPRRRWDGVVPMYKTRHHKDARRRRPEGH